MGSQLPSPSVSSVGGSAPLELNPYRLGAEAWASALEENLGGETGPKVRELVKKNEMKASNSMVQ